MATFSYTKEFLVNLVTNQGYEAARTFNIPPQVKVFLNPTNLSPESVFLAIQNVTGIPSGLMSINEDYQVNSIIVTINLNVEEIETTIGELSVGLDWIKRTRSIAPISSASLPPKYSFDTPPTSPRMGGSPTHNVGYPVPLPVPTTSTPTGIKPIRPKLPKYSHPSNIRISGNGWNLVKYRTVIVPQPFVGQELIVRRPSSIKGEFLFYGPIYVTEVIKTGVILQLAEARDEYGNKFKLRLASGKPVDVFGASIFICPLKYFWLVGYKGSEENLVVPHRSFKDLTENNSVALDSNLTLGPQTTRSGCA